MRIRLFQHHLRELVRLRAIRDRKVVVRTAQGRDHPGRGRPPEAAVRRAGLEVVEEF